MFKAIKEFFVGKPAEVAPVTNTAPYKVPEPAATIPIPVAPVVEVLIPETTVASVVVETSAPNAAPVAKEKAPTKAKAPKLTVVKAEKLTKVAKPKAPAKLKAEKAPSKKKT